MTSDPRYQTFTVFPNLPLELRRLIWNTTCVSRTVELECDAGELLTSQKSPVALEVCRESRETIIGSYPLCFGSIMFPAKIRFNFELDTLFIPMEMSEDLATLFATFRKPEIENLKWIAMDHDNVMEIIFEGEEIRGLQRALNALKGLKEVWLVFNLEDNTTRQIDCGDHHPKILYDKVPDCLSSIPFDKLPTWEDLNKKEEWKLWNGKVSSVYGWRKCPSWTTDAILRAFLDSDDIDDEDDEDEFDEDTWESEDESDDDMAELLPFETSAQAQIRADAIAAAMLELTTGLTPAAAGPSSSSAPSHHPADLTTVDSHGVAYSAEEDNILGSDGESID